MVTANTYKTYEVSVNNAKVVIGLEWLYEGMRNLIGKILTVTLAVVIGLPILYLFGFLLQRQRKKFRKNMRKNFRQFKTYKDYYTFKRNLNKLDSLMPALKKVSNYNIKKAPWVLRYTLGQMQKMTSTISTYNMWLKTRLKPLNIDHCKGSGQVFTLVSEQELWENRNHAYKYWM